MALVDFMATNLEENENHTMKFTNNSWRKAPGDHQGYTNHWRLFKGLLRMAY